MEKSNLPNGFLTIDEAVALIKTNTYDKPTVDIQWMIGNIDHVEELHNFNIRKVHLISKEELEKYIKDHHGRRPDDLVRDGTVYVYVATTYEKELLKKALKDNYRATSGREYKERHTRGVSTVKDEEAGNSERPRIAKKTIAKEGEIIGASSGPVTTNSADGAGV